MSSIEPEATQQSMIPPTPRNGVHVNLHAMTTTEARDRLDVYQKSHGFTNRGDALNALLLSVLPKEPPRNRELHE